MNEDQLKGEAKQGEGKLQELLGDAKEKASDLKEKAGDLLDDAKDKVGELRKEHSDEHGVDSVEAGRQPLSDPPTSPDIQTGP